MALLVKKKHEDIMKKKINDELRVDLGRTIVIHQRGTKVSCLWCYLDPVTGKSSGQSRPSKDWTTHSNYKGSTLVCPNCSGQYYIQDDTTTTITVIVEDKDDLELVEGKLGRVDKGTKRIIGKLSDISGDTDFNANILHKATKVVFDNLDYRIVSVKPIGLLNDFSFEAIMKRFDKMDIPSSGVLTS